MLFAKESLLVFFSNGKIAHHVKPNLSGLKNLLLELDFKRAPKVGRNSKPFLEISLNFGELSLASSRIRRTCFNPDKNMSTISWSYEVRQLMSSGFMLLGAEYFYPIYQNIKNGKPNLPLYFESMGPIYFKGTRLVNNDGEIVVPYIEYVEDSCKWQAGFKKSCDVIPDIKEIPRTLSVYVKKRTKKTKK